ncbi:MAG: 3-deoxy-D-manno-octulosonic acid transferase [Caulobacterales bacterium]|uniref:3-deoxy-D-manno-octulosonic acid transferase n=1 Tax=Glycocaulis sp. TaxID=1969725 RepID=UPI003F9F5E89
MKKLPPALGAYRALTGLAAPLAPSVLAGRARRGKEDAGRMAERLGHASVARPDGALVWIHGASVGESRVALTLASSLLAARPDLSVLMTSGTVTSAALIAREAPPGIIHQFVPADTPGAARRFMAHWKPDLGVFVESELWPNLIIEARRSGARLALVNARMNEASLRRWQRWKQSGKALMGCFDWISPADGRTAHGLAGLLDRKLAVAGNLKLEILPPMPTRDALDAARTILNGRKVWVAASTHAGEEEIVLQAHKELLASHPDALLILVPRHPDRAAEITALVEGAGLGLARRSAREAPRHDIPVWLADTLGEMSLWFALSRVALIAGSLKPGIGGHNPIEATRLGCQVVSGPYRDSFSDVYDAYEQHGAVVTVSDATALATAVRAQWEGAGIAPDAGETALDALTGNVLEMTTQKLVSLLTKPVETR